jgi:predicted RNase H-related nuclease YkuK (DUF458 family)
MQQTSTKELQKKIDELTKFVRIRLNRIEGFVSHQDTICHVEMGGDSRRLAPKSEVKKLTSVVESIKSGKIFSRPKEKDFIK